VSPGGQTAPRTEAGGATTTPYVAPSSPTSPTSTTPRAVPTTSTVPHAAPSTPSAPPTAPLSQLYLLHYSCLPWVAWEPSAPPLHQQLPPMKAVPVAPPVNPHPMIVRAFQLPINRLTLLATSVSTLSLVPSSVHVSLIDPNWHHAMEEESAALIANNTWDLVPRPVGSNIVISKWIFMHKFNSNSSLERYKAH
jgi:hypothetical protein